MKLTVSVIKADIGSVGGHIAPSKQLLETVEHHVRENGMGFLKDAYVSYTGDDVAILMTHRRHLRREDPPPCLGGIPCGTKVAKEQGLYGAGQDLLKDSFTGNVCGMGPAVAEMEIEERPNEPFLFFAADKTDPGAYNLPLYLAFADVMNTPGLILAPKMGKGFRFVIMDVNYTEGDRIIELNARRSCTTSQRCSATPNGSWSSLSGPVPPASRPPWCPRPGCTTSPASTRARTTQSCSSVRR